jgi:hypothetical protein
MRRRIFSLASLNTTCHWEQCKCVVPPIPDVVGCALDCLALVGDDDLVHAELLGHEVTLPVPRVELQVHRTRGTCDHTKYVYCTVRNAHFNFIGNQNVRVGNPPKFFEEKIREIFTRQSQQRRPRVSEIFYYVSGIINYDFFSLGVFRFPKAWSK